MAFSAVAWAYKDSITSTKLAQMVENTRTHDHRTDGTQGAPFKLSPPDAPHAVGAAGEPAFENGWTGHASSPLKFWRDAAGNTHVRGLITGGVVGGVVFTLPAGYRPTAQWVTMQTTDVNAGVAELVAKADGTVSLFVKAGASTLYNFNAVFSTL